MKQPTFKSFRELLNRKYPLTKYKHKNYAYHQEKRAWGDYVYFQDRERFNWMYREWIDTGKY